jgi:leader peptidase (prepilin peptidase)/N-methyltransferase
MNPLATLLETPALFIASAALVGLVVGSFLNVVIHRLPIMLERSWRDECETFMNLPPAQAESPRFDLVAPRSHCPQCEHAVGALENIPILSYLWLKGRCAHCRAPISPRYPIVEAIAALASALVAWKLGPSWQAASALILTWGLIALSGIDLDKRLLPDSITLPLLWLGLGLSLFGLFADSASAIIGAIAGYLSLWLVYHAFRLLTGKEGMGYGDFKLLAAFGAWLGWQCLLPVLLLSSLVGAAIGGGMILAGGRGRDIPIPFGPYLSIAGWIALLWGREILDAYWRYAGAG